MKKYICLIILLLVLSGRPVFADFNQTKQEYLDLLSKYNQAQSEYLIAKNTYQTYQTLAALTKALETSKTFLTRRDELLIKHFQLLNSKIEETEFSGLITKEGVKTLTDNEIVFFQNHLGLIPAIATLKDTTEASKKAEEEIVLANIKSKQILGKILIAKVQELSQTYAKLRTDVRNELEDAKSKPYFSKEKIDKIERWLVEVENKKVLCDNNLNRMANRLNGLKKESMDLEKDFNEARINIIQSSLYLKEGNNYMKEILEEMKYQ